MWREYIASSVKQNRASSRSVMVAALIAAMFLSLLGSLFYNFWTYDIERIVLEEGGWQGRITGMLSEADISAIQAFPNVETAVVNAQLSDGTETAIDIVFCNAKTIYDDMPRIVSSLGLPEDAACYHALLLSRYLIHDPQDAEPPLLLAFYLAVLGVVSVSLVLIIHNSFAVSMQARTRQFGILSSVGATPGQIRACLMQEAALLCAVPILLGSGLGVALSYGILRAANRFAAGVAGRHDAVFQAHPLVLAGTLLLAALTVLVSAWLPARKLSRLTPLEAIRNAGELRLKRKRRSPVLSLLFGVEGELAGNALHAQRKALRTATLSLTLSFLGFTLMLCFFTLSRISTDHTYFARYQDAWDVMATVRNAKIEDFVLSEPLSTLQGAKSSVAYQKAAAECRIPADRQSDALRALGGLQAVANAPAPPGGDFAVQAPIVILDDAAFLAYCSQIGAPRRLDGTVVINRVWDSVNSGFRYKSYIPYVREDRDTIALQGAGRGAAIELPVLAYACEAPVLREEYDNYALVQILPASLWKSLSGQLGGAQPELYVRILAGDGAGLAELDALEADVSQLVGKAYDVETENRIREKMENDTMLDGFALVLGAFCALLAVIGLANVFSNTLGFLRQRRQEFARYLSVGMTPKGLRRMFCAEALAIAGRPALITLPLTAVSVGLMITASHLEPAEFMMRAPVLPILLFLLAIFGFVALAYYIGGKRVLKCSLAEALRNDTV